DARDSVQQIFLKVLSEIHRHEVIYFKAWIYQVAKNHSLMQLRYKKDVELKEELVPGAAEQEDIRQTAHVQKDLMLDNMERALGELNPDQAIAVRLFYLDKKSYQEISDITGFNSGQVKSYIQNGKRNLKILLE